MKDRSLSLCIIFWQINLQYILTETCPKQVIFSLSITMFFFPITYKGRQKK